jgi:hypothetical protein
MHHHSQLEGLVTEPFGSRLGEAEESQLAHRARVDSRATRTTRGKAGLKKLWLPVPRLSAPRSTCDTPGIGLRRGAS